MVRATGMMKKWFEPAVTPLYVILTGAVSMGIYSLFYAANSTDIQFFNKHKLPWEDINPSSSPRRHYISQKFAQSIEKH